MTDDPSPGEGGDVLDRLLGVAALPQPGPWFAARTLARCRHGRETEAAPFRWSVFFPRWALPAMALLLVGGVGLQQAHRIHTLETHRQHRVQEAFEVMANMGGGDTDAAVQDSSL